MISVKAKRKLLEFVLLHCIHTKIFWIDVELFNKKMFMSGFYVIIYFVDHGFDKDKAYFILVNFNTKVSQN